MRYWLVVLVAALVAAVPSLSFAGGFCCQLRTGVSETLGGGPSGAGSISASVDYTYSHMYRIFEGDSRTGLREVLQDPRFKQMMGIVPEDMDMQRITLNAGYTVTDDLRMFVSVPWVINDMTMRMYMMNKMPMGMPMAMAMPMTGSWKPMEMDRISGIGDVSVFGLYRVYKDKDIMPRRALSVGVGLKCPTGSWTESQGGRRVHAHMQPGTGSWDPMLKLVYVQMLSSEFLLNAGMTYQFTTENPLGYEFGDTFSANADLYYNLFDFLNVSAGAEYFHSEQADDRENNYNGWYSKRMMDFTGNTGEDSVWVKGGVQFLPFDGASIDLDVSYPLYYHVGGIQLTTDYKLSMRASVGF